MKNEVKLMLIKVLHTIIWIFFNVVIGYMVYAVATNRIDTLLWLCFGFVLTEGLVLLAFGWTCPLSLLARRYSSSTAANFDIYLPMWLAKHTKVIYTSLSLLILVFAIYRIVQ